MTTHPTRASLGVRRVSTRTHWPHAVGNFGMEAARLERASNKLWALKPVSLPLAAGCRRHPIRVEKHPTVV